MKQHELSEAINGMVCATARIDDTNMHVTYLEEGQEQPLIITYIGGDDYKVLYGHKDFSWIEKSDVLLKKLADKCDSSGFDRLTAEEYIARGNKWGWD